ncbi:YpjP family protein [Alkalicoccus halolimnae]|uniref:YpjP family protein n=1 Tax=Alkalicoccus halolimnae TaxID=1667239 RepID=A0A5C7F9K6_9BACI|nr:YpjP family protein [Alkalicoccus halolimnae]TXF86068.1 hypothetical protein FTX54_05465 [Alkalicoccus halolimnae]
MKIWLRKFTIIMLTVLTLGAYVPPVYGEAESDNDEEFPDAGKQGTAGSAFDNIEDSSIEESEEDIEDLWSMDAYIDEMTLQAREQMMSKLGPKIVNRVEDDILEDILPQIEDVISHVYEQSGEETVPNFTITEHPSTGYGEKIFHIYDEDAETDIVRFHVRRDMKPKQGYFFNFHYHLKDDGFEEHHSIGDIYWDKNTPPKWMAH